MRTTGTALFLAGLLAFTAVEAGARLAVYANARYGYSVSYPADLLVAQPESDAGDGRQFKARTGTAKFLVWAAGAPFADTRDEAADESSCLRHPASYRAVKPALVVISCETQDGILYRETLFNKDASVSLQATYPKTEHAIWDPVVAEMARSLTRAHPL